VRELYKSLTPNSKLKDLLDWAIHATRARQVDKSDYDIQNSGNPLIYTASPSSSSDLIGTEKVGDISMDTGFLYIIVDNAGTLEWRQVAISSF